MTKASTILLKHLLSFKLNYLHTKILPLIIALKLVPHFDLKVAALSTGLPTFTYATSLISKQICKGNESCNCFKKQEMHYVA